MNPIQFLAEWALRSSILILAGALLLWLLRVKDPSIRLAAWTAILCGSLAIPAITTALPAVPVRVIRPVTIPLSLPVTFDESAQVITPAPANAPTVHPKAVPIDWKSAAAFLYTAVTFAMLLRLCVGLAMGRRFLRQSRAAAGRGDRESDRVTTPVTLGIIHPAVVLPVNWRGWESAKLNAVLVHEQSHIARHDPAVQLLSSLHRALLWFSPLTWFLHARIVRVAEEASDDAAVAATGDRTTYAEILLDFVRQATPQANLAGVSMARYGRPDKRIHRILDATSLSRGVTRWSVLTILTLGAPLAYLAASASPEDMPARTVTVVQRATSAPPAVEITLPETRRLLAQASAPPLPAPKPQLETPPEFDAASIRQVTFDGGGGRGGPQGGAPLQFTPGRVASRTAEGVSARRIVLDAYHLLPYQLSGGPDWVDSDRFVVEGKTETPADEDRLRLMLQTLLSQRFKLVVHRESRQMAVYALVVAKKGLKLHELKEGDSASTPLEKFASAGAKSLVLQGSQAPVNIYTHVDMQQFAGSLATNRLANFDQPVVDETGLHGFYSFGFQWDPNEDYKAAVEEQLGLKFEPRKAAVDVLVIDRIERPSAN